MQVNVATLLQEQIGSSRDIEISAEPIAAAGFDYRRVIDGTLQLLRTERGVLARVRVALTIPLECARCLEAFEDQIDVEFEEEFVLAYPHPTTGVRPVPEEGDFLIDDHWHLDLSEAVRQYEQSAVPLMALCRPDCPGFAAEPSTAVPTALTTTDNRWSALSGLAARLHEEESDGAPEA